MKKRLMFLTLMALFGVGRNAWATENLICSFSFTADPLAYEYILYYGDVPRSTLPPNMSYADDVLLQDVTCTGTSCEGTAYYASVSRDLEFYAALIARNLVTGELSGFSNEFHYDPNAQSVPEPPPADGFIPEPSFTGLSLCQGVQGLADGSYLLVVSGETQTVYAGVCETGYSLSLFSTSVEINEGESVTLRANSSGTNTFTVDGVTKCNTSSTTCVVSGLAVGTHTASVSNNGTTSNSLVITVSAPVVSSSIFDGLSSGDYRVRLDASGNPTVVEVLGNNPPSISISTNKVEYIDGEIPATIAVVASDPEGDTLTTVCYADGSLMSGLTTNSFLIGSHTVYCIVGDGTNSVSSNSLTVNVLDGPHMSLPVSVSFEANVGDTSAATNITVANSGNGIFNWTAGTTATWLSLNSSVGVNGDVVTVTANLNGLPAGSYSGNIIFESPDTDNPSVVVPVNLTIADVKQNTASLDLEKSSYQYAYISDFVQTGLDITGSLTVEVSIKVESQPINFQQDIVGKWGNTGANNSFAIVYNDIAGIKSLIFVIESGSGQETLQVIQTLSNGVWYHITGVFDSSAKTMRLFLNGTQIGTVKSTSISSIQNTSTRFEIGRRGTGSSYWDGLIDEVRVWSVARSTEQIIANYQKSIDSAPGLQGSWHFNGEYTDSSGNGNHLTPNGSSVFSTNIP